METKFDKKIICMVKKFASLPSDSIHSDHFVVGGCKWHLQIYPKGDVKNATHLSLYLAVANPNYSLPSGGRRHVKYRITVVNQLFDKLSLSNASELGRWFDQKSTGWGFRSMCPLNVIHAKDSGFLLNGELKIQVEIKVIQVIGELDVTEETTLTIREDVHGFLLLPSQVKYVSRIFERHPDVASDFRPKNSNLRIGYMNLLLSLIETISQLPQQMSKDDLVDAYAALGTLRNVGFKLDWLEKKLDEVSKKMEDKKTIEAGLQEAEKELRTLKHKCSDMKDLVEKKKAKLSVVKAPVSFDDIVD